MRELKEYFRPASPEEAVEIKREYGEAASYLAGGSDLLVHRPPELRAMIDIRHAGLGYARSVDGQLAIGGAALLRDAEAESGDVAGGMLQLALRETAPWLIRNAATVAGNIANASPAADSVPALLALDAEVVLLGDSEVSAALGEILTAPHRTSLDGRLIREIRVPVRHGQLGAFIKLARSKSDIAQVNVAVALQLESGVARGVRIALGAVAPTAVRARGAEALLEGEAPSAEILREVQRVVENEVSPIDDWRASAAYRRRMAGVLARRALEEAIGPTENGVTT
jgi:aerobic carbon-monoxide dehydrogenase medium subunit